MENSAENPSNLAVRLGEAIQGFGDALQTMSNTLKECRESGMSDLDIRDTIMTQIPEEDHQAFMQQWPMLSMMFAVL